MIFTEDEKTALLQTFYKLFPREVGIDKQTGLLQDVCSNWLPANIERLGTPRTESWCNEVFRRMDDKKRRRVYNWLIDVYLEAEVADNEYLAFLKTSRRRLLDRLVATLSSERLN